MRALRAFFAALAYFTILPVPARAHRGEPPDAYALAVLPFVGAIVGAAAGGFGWLASLILPGFAGVAAFAASIVLTGAIHVDGFLDCCDGVLASATPQRRLEILRDPRHGTFAIAGMAVLVVVWIWALNGLLAQRLPLALAFSGCTSRLAALANAYVFRYARSGEPQPTVATAPPVAAYAIALALSACLAWAIGPWKLALVPAAVALAFFIGWYASVRLGGGITGDVYGAAISVVDVAVLLAL